MSFILTDLVGFGVSANASVTLEWLLCGGGGAGSAGKGGVAYGSGGAGGEVVEGSQLFASPTLVSLTVTIGPGGSGSAAADDALGTDGTASSVSGSLTLSAPGGGRSTNYKGGNSGVRTGGTVTAVDGKGGASSAASNTGLTGVNGISSSISGSAVIYGSGGGGAGGTGGAGGSGAGSGATASGSGGAGTANRGGGGGGGVNVSGGGGTGGSGVFIVRYLGATPLFTGGTVTYAGGYVIHTFTSSGSLVALAANDNEVLEVVGKRANG